MRELGDTEVAFVLLNHLPRGLIILVRKQIFRESLGKKLILCCREASGQRLDNVNRSHLVLASGKLVLQKEARSDLLCIRRCKNVASLVIPALPFAKFWHIIFYPKWPHPYRFHLSQQNWEKDRREIKRK